MSNTNLEEAVSWVWGYQDIYKITLTTINIQFMSTTINQDTLLVLSNAIILPLLLSLLGLNS